jgi:hypothetical protein
MEMKQKEWDKVQRRGESSGLRVQIPFPLYTWADVTAPL